MKTHFLTLHFCLTLGVLLLTATLTSSNLAQTPTAPVGYRVQVIQTNPGMSDEWRKFYQTEILPVLKKAGVKEQTVAVTIYGDTRRYIIVTPLESLAQLDEPAILNKVLGAEAAHALSIKQGRFLAEWQRYVTAARPDLSIPATLKDPKLAISIKHTVAPGRNAEYEKWVKENLLMAGKKADSKGALATKVVFGGDQNEYRTYVLADSYADVIKLQAGMTKAAAELKLSLTPPPGVVNQVEVTVVRLVPELSIQPGTQKIEGKK
ncbi:MAG: hypothetical protein KA368_19600 [Acidobacteria bacterium]|nr:hypothetical protein [Acidobacteriota bacterium]